MKKSLSVFIFVLAAVTLTAAEYTFTALGDIHFDGKEYHNVPAATRSRKKERERNLSMWANGSSDKVLSAAAKATKKDAAFVVQLGDFTQGDADTKELQEKMFTDGFAKVKSYFPDLKLLAVKGNHDVRVLNIKGNCNEPADKAFLPLIAKELGREKISGNYFLKHGRDLFIFYDSFAKDKKGVAFVKKTLEANKDARYVFFFTHLPLLPCCEVNPGWLLHGRSKILPMLAKRNAIVLTAHTHRHSFMSVKTPDGTISQMVVCSMGIQWNPKTAPSVKYDKFETLKKICLNNKRVSKKSRAVLDEMGNYTVNDFKMYSGHSSFVIVNVDDKGVTADIYTNDSGKARSTVTLRTNTKTEK